MEIYIAYINLNMINYLGRLNAMIRVFILEPPSKENLGWENFV